MEKAEIRDWLGLDVTKEFLSGIHQLIEDKDRDTHRLLNVDIARAADNFFLAAIHNEGINVLRDVLNSIDKMMEEAADET